MFFSEPKTFYDSVKPLIYINCIFGIGALRIPNQSTSTYVLMKIYIIFITLMNWTVIYFALNSIAGFIATDETSPMALGMLKALVCANSSITVIAPFLVWVRRKGLKECLQKIPILDNTFETVLGASNEYRKQFIRLTLQIISIWFIMILVAICGNVFGQGMEFQLSTQSAFTLHCVTQALHQPIVVMLVLDVNFCSFVGYSEQLIFILSTMPRYLGKKFRYLNDSLLRLAEKSFTSRSGDRLFVISQNAVKTIPRSELMNTEAGGLVDGRHYMLREIRKAHMELCKLSRKINRMFGIQNLLSAGISFVMITGLLYTIYSSLLWKSRAIDKFKQVLPSVLWAAIYILKIWMVNHTCWNVSSEAERTGDVIYELLNTKVAKEFRTEIHEFGVQMLQNPVRFNACGFFILDYTFVQGVIGSITTYLVILIQMSPVSQTPILDTAFNHTENSLDY